MSTGLALINAVIRTGARSAFRELSPDLFLPAELPVYQFVDQFYRRYAALPSAEALIENGFRLPPAGNPIEYYLERLRVRMTYNLIAAEQQSLWSAMNARDMDQAAQVLARMNAGVAHYRTANEIQSYAEVAQEVLEQYRAAHDNPGLRGITLGYEYLDDLTEGAQPGDVITLPGRPGEGKSYTIAKMALSAWLAGNATCFATMEMTNRQTGTRFVGLQSGLNPKHIRRGQLSQWGEETMYETISTIQHGAPFHLLSGNFKKTVRDIDNMIMEFRPDIVFVDASYLLKPENQNSRKARWELLSDVGEEIKSIALERRVPIVQTVQFNREAKKDKDGGSLENMGGTDVIPQISTVVVSIREGLPPYEKTRRRYKILKNREGPTGEFTTNFLFDPINFDFIPAEEAGGDTPAPAPDTNVEWML